MGRLSGRSCSVSLDICAHAATRGTEVRLWCLYCNSSKRCSVGLRTMPCAGHFSLGTPCLCDPRFKKHLSRFGPLGSSERNTKTSETVVCFQLFSNSLRKKYMSVMFKWPCTFGHIVCQYKAAYSFVTKGLNEVKVKIQVLRSSFSSLGKISDLSAVLRCSSSDYICAIGENCICLIFLGNSREAKMFFFFFVQIENQIWMIPLSAAVNVNSHGNLS